MKCHNLGSTWKQQATTDTARPRRGKAWPANQRQPQRSPAQPGTGRPRRGSETRRLRYALRGPGNVYGFPGWKGVRSGTRPPCPPRPGPGELARTGPTQRLLPAPGLGPGTRHRSALCGPRRSPGPAPAATAPAAGRLRAEAAAPGGRRGQGAGGHRTRRETRPRGTGRGETRR